MKRFLTLAALLLPLFATAQGWQWVQDIETGNSSFTFHEVRAVAVDGSGNVYVTGRFQDTATFGNGQTASSSGSYDIFIAAYDGSGNCRWVQAAGGSSTDRGYGIAVDGSGTVAVGGWLQGTAASGSGHAFGSINVTASDAGVGFVAQYSPAFSLATTSNVPNTACIGSEDIDLTLTALRDTLPAGDSIFLGYRLDTLPAVRDTLVLTDTLFADSSLTFTFAQQPVITSGAHTLKTWVKTWRDSV